MDLNKKIKFSIVMIFSIILFSISSVFSAGGSGTVNDPYIMNTCAELQGMVVNNALHYKLGNDIDCSSTSWTKIGTSTGSDYWGQLNGNGYSIIGLNNPMFGFTDANAKIYNLTLKNGNIVSYNNFNGALVGENYGLIEYVKVTGYNIYGEDYVGGFVSHNRNGGRIKYSGVENSSLYLHSGTSDYVGGFVGMQDNGGEIYESYAKINNVITGYNFLGGFIGRNDGQIFDSYAKANLNGNVYIGGFVGHNYGSTTTVARIYRSYASGNVVGTSTFHAFMGGQNVYSSNGYTYNCYYDRETSLDSSNYGAIGLLTSEIKTLKPFNGYETWDFITAWYWDETKNDGHLSLRKVDNVPYNITPMTGTGVNGNPLIITNCWHLYEIDYDSNKLGLYYRLNNNISCSGVAQRPIGGNFVGNFDGNDMTISDTYVDLFENIYTNAQVYDLRIENALLIGGYGSRGILTRNNYGVITNVFVNGAIYDTLDNIGGLVGTNQNGGRIYKSISYAYIYSSTTQSDYVGGLVGYQPNGGIIYESYSHNNVIQGYQGVGGFIGRNDGQIFDSYTHSPSVQGYVNVGGFVGHNYGISTTVGQIYRSYSIGQPSGNSAIGGFVGASNTYGGSNGQIYQSFWDITTSGTTNSVSMAVGKYSADMKNIKTYSGSNIWDFDTIWYMDNVTGYPKLRNLDKVFNPIPSMVGDGSVGNPFQIVECRQLKEIQDSLTSNYIIMNDLDCAISEMHRVGTFQGTLEGNNKVIYSTYSPLFETLGASAVVKNLGITNHLNSEQLDYYGVLARYNTNGRIQNVYVSGTIDTGNDYNGGLVGQSSGGIIEDSESYVNINGNGANSDYLGGLVGYQLGNAQIYRSFSKGNTVTGHNYIGGLVGQNQYGHIYDSYAMTNVLAFQGAGGLIGYNYAHTSTPSFIYRSYATGSVDATSNTYEGGLAGYNYVYSPPYGGFYNSYWDTQTTGQTIGAGNQNYGTGLTTSQMKIQSNLAGFDFATVWFMDSVSNNGYANHISFIPLVVTPFDVTIFYPMNTELMTLNSSISPITFQYAHNSDNATTMVCRQYLDGVLFKTDYNVGTAIQSTTLNRWIEKQYLYEVRCFDGIITELTQHQFTVNVDIDLIGPNPNTNPSGGGDINISEILDAINSLNLTVTTTQGNTTVIEGETKIYHSYSTGSQYFSQSDLDKLNLANLTAVYNPVTQQIENTTNKTVIDITELYNTLTLKDGTTFANVKPKNFYDNVLMKPYFDGEKLGIENTFGKWLLENIKNWMVALTFFGLVTWGMSSIKFGKTKGQRVRNKIFYVAVITAVLIFLLKIFINLILYN